MAAPDTHTAMQTVADDEACPIFFDSGFVGKAQYSGLTRFLQITMCELYHYFPLQYRNIPCQQNVQVVFNGKINYDAYHIQYNNNNHNNTCLKASFPGQPGKSAPEREINSLDFNEARDDRVAVTSAGLDASPADFSRHAKFLHFSQILATSWSKIKLRLSCTLFTYLFSDAAECSHQFLFSLTFETSCKKWVHKKCSGIKDSIYKVMKSFICRSCVNPVTGTGCTSVDIGGDANLELVDKFCYLGDMLMQLWRPEFELGGINSGSWYCCLPKRIYH